MASLAQRSRITQFAAQAQQIMKETGVPASIILGQMALETGWLKHFPAGSNNPFGIKAKAGQPFVVATTREFEKGKWITIQAKFRKYDSITDALRDHARLLQTSRYRACLNKSYREAARIIHQSGYATDPQYANKLIATIDANKFYAYDTLAGPAKPKPVSLLEKLKQKGILNDMDYWQLVMDGKITAKPEYVRV
ncbi:glucosaminidase domain-containing protein, partial [Salmonella enterica]|nr:glucosaminidase domain-containing protein [Salmonella enterica]